MCLPRGESKPRCFLCIYLSEPHLQDCFSLLFVRVFRDGQFLFRFCQTSTLALLDLADGPSFGLLNQTSKEHFHEPYFSFVHFSPACWNLFLYRNCLVCSFSIFCKGKQI